MTQVTVGTTPTKLASAGNRRYLHIYNNDAQPIFLCWDGATDPAGAGTALTTANGFPLASKSFIFLDNDSIRNHYNDDVYAISVAGGADVRLQGV
jgi:hypothetical protein